MTLPAHRRERVRLDRLLVERGLIPTREKARALILAGRVTAGGRRLDKPGTQVADDAPLEVKPGPRWASRGGEKLDGALDRLGVEVAERDAIDVGASTGGFTDVLLGRGARRVIALDVGRGQLDWRLRNDPRVHVVDGANARYLAPTLLPWIPELAVVDVSFISLRAVLPAVARCLGGGAEMVALVKPQFEVGRGAVGRGGIVREREEHRRVLAEIVHFVCAEGWRPAGVCAAPIAGASGNQEYFVHVLTRDSPPDEPALAEAISRAIEEGQRP